MPRDIQALHEAATPAPWRQSENTPSFVRHENRTIVQVHDPVPYRGDERVNADASLIVALRNTYASGDLITREQHEHEMDELRRQRDYTIQRLEELHKIAAASVEFCADGIMQRLSDNGGEFNPTTDSGCEHNSSCDTCCAYPIVKLLFGESIAREQQSIREEAVSDE